MKNIKDTLSSIIAVLIVFFEPINYWLMSNEPFNWKTFVSSMLVAAIAYFTGKNADLSSKTPKQIEVQEDLKS